MRRCPQPIVSCLQGAASGGGFAFALATDIKIAGESLKMNSAFIKLGLSSCDMGVSYFLPRLVRDDDDGAFCDGAASARHGLGE
jgi:enoyl-CoA hydratase/carnithine racemase